jgi:MerR family transcriptional regulator, light-induced transcriptional regulator
MSSFSQDALSPMDSSQNREPSEAQWSPGSNFSGKFNSANQDNMHPSEEAIDLRLAMLARAIEHEIIPRLMLAHRETHECVASLPKADQVVTRKEVEDFADLVLSSDEAHAQASVDAMLIRGIAVETIYLNLLAPVARLMGEMWEQDLCDFTQVTLGLGRLHQVLRALSPAFEHPAERTTASHRILLLPGPGDQHTFGLVMVSEFFRRAGWHVSGGAWQTNADAATLVKNEWFDVLGFSVGAETQLESLRLCVDSARKSTRNTQLVIMVGGPIIALRPECMALVGADCVASDGKQAPEIAKKMVSSRRQVAGQ